jgi:Asp-tRNA(Asn)/Glu-tRNA(Gln) amidotransferase B subunit
MEEGSLRCDANVSVRLKGAQEKFGTKVEVKNVNSFRFVRAALEYEIERQIEVIESGGRVMQESRCGTPPRAAPIRCARRSRPTTTATSPSRTCRR